MTDHLSEEQISASVDGQLEAEERRLLEAHLPGCEKCRKIFEEMSEVTRLFRHEELTPPPDLWRRISSKLDSPGLGSWRWRLSRTSPLFKFGITVFAKSAMSPFGRFCNV